MNDQRLTIYLNDHLAAVTAELELAKRCRENNRGSELEEFLGQVVGQLEGQRAVIRQVVAAVGGSEDLAKQGAAWLSEKAGRFKLNDALMSYSPLSQLVELEWLTWGADLRALMWETLVVLQPADSRLMPFAFSQLRSQTLDMGAQLGQHRLAAADQAFLPRTE